MVGGTAWDFTNAGPAARRGRSTCSWSTRRGSSPRRHASRSRWRRSTLLLLGDPQQLPQVTQGAPPRARRPAPRSAGSSAATRTLPAHLGYFLGRTWRMHPALCAAVSRLSYERRLAVRAVTAARSLDGVPPGSACVEVEHTGNAVASAEEAGEVSAQVGRCSAARGTTRPRDPPDRPLGRTTSSSSPRTTRRCGRSGGRSTPPGCSASGWARSTGSRASRPRW